tara:strand:+ start:1655 stop:2488 length:834 start_codon:yes stop_codon:yes gene_type:complete
MSCATNKFNIVRIILNKSIFDENIIYIILKYYWELLDKRKVLLDWIDINKLNWDNLSKNYNAIDLLKENYDKINWENLSMNYNALFILYKNINKVSYIGLIKNKNKNIEKDIFFKKLNEKTKLYYIKNKPSINLLKNNLNVLNYFKETDWKNLSSNCDAISILENNKDKIDWSILSTNENAIDLLEENQDKINWRLLSGNKNAINLLKNNKDKINWFNLSGNPSAINILKENEDKIVWKILSENENAINLLKKNQKKINYYFLSKNPEIFVDEHMPI